ncbi:hypothetical protein RNJ44_03618 [Nakaseomyces bracarensis]|uniref:Uncharacterized protein n=1 Tax=Nakaseomyces bracarensis TaxID=273131 RepID=A0ABR4NXE5_9SACH
MGLESLLYVFSVLVTVVQYSCYVAVTLLLIPFLGIYGFDLFLYLYRIVDYTVKMLSYRKRRSDNSERKDEVRNYQRQEKSRTSSIFDANLTGLGKLFIVYDLGVWIARHVMGTFGKVESSSRTKST